MNLHADPGRPVPFTLTDKARAALRYCPESLAADRPHYCEPADCCRDAYLSRPAARPPVVCLCGSTRFYDEFRRANLRLTVAGQIVLSIGCDTKSDGDLADAGELAADLADLKTRLGALHKRKIDLADYVLVLNVGGYIGASTRSEIAYATAAGTPVSYLELPAGATEPEAIPAGQWACTGCGAGYFGAAPETGRCPLCLTGGAA